jgi:hypothetical protein
MKFDNIQFKIYRLITFYKGARVKDGLGTFPRAVFSSAAVCSTARDALVQMDKVLLASAATSTALLSRPWRC